MLAAIWYGFIFYLSHIPSTAGVVTGEYFYSWNYLFRGAAHCFVFGVQSFLIFRECTLRSMPLKKSAVMAVALTMLLGFLDELHQYYVPGRFFRIRDIALDTASATIVSGLCFKFIAMRYQRLFFRIPPIKG